MIITTINTGSTSVKLGAYETDAQARLRQLARERHEIGAIENVVVLGTFFGRFPPRAVAHRIVHGGAHFTRPVALERNAERVLQELSILAPLHNPRALEWLTAARRIGPADSVHVGVFDTAFFAALPPVATTYAVPRAIGADIGVRRYGFHGIAHQAMWRRWCMLRPDLERGGRLITLQLGGGCSAAAIDRGQPMDTSMGFTPLEGLVMGTRSGDIDPAAVPFIARRLGETGERVIERLNTECGLAGVSGLSADFLDLIREASDASELAIELYCQRIRKYVGGYMAVLGGCDGIVFGGGVGEHVPEVRSRVLRDMEWCGAVLDTARNQLATGAEACISDPASRVHVHVVNVDEDFELALAAADYVQRRGSI
jgi:acetate kinase